MKKIFLFFLLFLVSIPVNGEPPPLDPEEQRVIPNDPYFKHQWWADNDGTPFLIFSPISYRHSFINIKKDIDLDLPEAWAIEQGSKDCVIAILGDGFQLDHEDLQYQIWTNPLDSSLNYSDEDKNNLVDDIHGWNFLLKNNTLNLPEKHGTDLAGIAVGSIDNGVGIAGVAPKCSVMPLVFRSPLEVINNQTSYEQRSEAWAKAVRYAKSKRVTVISISYTLKPIQELISMEEENYEDGKIPEEQLAQLKKDYRDDLKIIYKAIREAYDAGIPVVAAAGNSDDPEVQKQKHFPAAFPEVISVGAVSPKGEPSLFSVHGDWVNVSAPGEYIFTTSKLISDLEKTPCGFERVCTNHPNYTHVAGTSYSAPMVAGVVALLRSHYPNMSIEEIRTTLIQTG